MAKLAVIIVSWNTRELLEGCLQSLFAHTREPGLEVIVVDNASKDGSAEMVRDRFPQARLVENPTNGGFAQANNLGLRESAATEYVLLLNPDTLVRPGAVDTLVRFLDVNPRAGAAGARLLNTDGSLQRSCYPNPTLGREFWRMFHLDRVWPYALYPLERWSLEVSREVDILMGACLMLRREALDQVGPMDEGFFMYSEEVDLCYRVQQAGWRLYWVPQAQVVHFGGQSTRQAAAEMFLRLYQAKVMYFRKHYPRWEVSAYKTVLMLATLSRLALTSLTIFERPARRSEHRMLSHNYRRLLFSLPGW